MRWRFGAWPAGTFSIMCTDKLSFFFFLSAQYMNDHILVHFTGVFYDAYIYSGSNNKNNNYYCCYYNSNTFTCTCVLFKCNQIIVVQILHRKRLAYKLNFSLIQNT